MPKSCERCRIAHRDLRLGLLAYRMGGNAGTLYATGLEVLQRLAPDHLDTRRERYDKVIALMEEAIADTSVSNAEAEAEWLRLKRSIEDSRTDYRKRFATEESTNAETPEPTCACERLRAANSELRCVIQKLVSLCKGALFVHEHGLYPIDDSWICDMQEAIANAEKQETPDGPN